MREADGNLILEITFSDTLSGTFTGIATGNLTCVVKSTGEGTCHGTESFTGTVCVDGDCRSGTLVFRDAVKLDGASVEGHFATSSGTGGLEDLHAVGTFQGAAGAGTYTTQGHFDPK